MPFTQSKISLGFAQMRIYRPEQTKNIEFLLSFYRFTRSKSENEKSRAHNTRTFFALTIKIAFLIFYYFLPFYFSFTFFTYIFMQSLLLFFSLFFLLFISRTHVYILCVFFYIIFSRKCRKESIFLLCVL